MAGKRGRPREDERAERDERVLRVATELFLAHGFEGVALDAVAAAADVTKRTLYSSIGDKRDLFRAVVRRQHQYASLHQEAGDLFEAALAVHRSLLADQAVALHRVVVSAAPRFPDLAEEFYESGPRAAQAFLAKHLVDAGESADSAPLLFSLLLGEPHRRRLLGLDAEPTVAESRDHVARALAAILSTAR